MGGEEEEENEYRQTCTILSFPKDSISIKFELLII